ncbi:hypothetical protein LJK88_35210 [Paenibacillus sp. P26]|nr:hypothetical protein LJK88_35210 [Paenibacillus sp. P26]
MPVFFSIPETSCGPKHTAITVKAVDGRVQTIEGASEADSFPLLSGYFIIEVADAEEAVRWASLAPAAVQGSVECGRSCKR